MAIESLKKSGTTRETVLKESRVKWSAVECLEDQKGEKIALDFKNKRR